ncbi:MAG: glycoside hydrolase family 57 protein [Phycisphaerales bacterium]
MSSVCFYFQVHQPFRLRNYTIFDNGTNYYDDFKNAQICRKVADKCYLPANRLMLELIKKYNGKFRISYSITGVILEQLEKYAPDALDTFKQLADTGCVEFLAETYYHTLSSLYSHNEFTAQVDLHIAAIQKYFSQTPRIFRNTELVYNNQIAELIESMGRFDAIIAEGADHILGYKSPNFVYQPLRCKNLKLLLKNYRLSDDIAFRFSNQGWADWPLTAPKFAQWVDAINGCGYTVNLFMDYETFGEHQWESTGIFNFLRHLPEEILKHPDNNFKTPSEVVKAFPASETLDIPYTVSWADIERDLSAWLGNPMQHNALTEIYKLEDSIKSAADDALIADWRKLQTSDHFYYMCTKWFSDGDVHKYFNPYDSPYDSYINFMNVMDNLNTRCSDILSLKKMTSGRPQKKTSTKLIRRPLRKNMEKSFATGLQ